MITALGAVAFWSLLVGLVVLLSGGNTVRRVGRPASALTGYLLMMIALVAFLALLFALTMQRLLGWE